MVDATLNFNTNTSWIINAKDLLGHHEGGDHKYVYDDGRGNLTFGKGLLLDAAAIKRLPKNDKKDIVAGKLPVPESIRTKLFNERFKEAQETATKFVGNTRDFNKLSAARKQVLTSMAYQLGRTKLNKFSKFRTHLQAMIKAKGTEQENFFRNEAMGEMADSKWFREDNTHRSTDLIGSFVSDQIFIEGQYKSPKEVFKLSEGKQQVADDIDSETARSNLPLPEDPIEVAERFNTKVTSSSSNLKDGITFAKSKVVPVSDDELFNARKKIAENEKKNKKLAEGRQLLGTLKENNLSISRGSRGAPAPMFIPSDPQEIQDVTGVTDFSVPPNRSI
jgi:hypothetical protein